MRSGWEDLALDEVCQFKGGSGFKENLQGKKSGDFAFIKVSDLNLSGNEKYVTVANNWVSQKDLSELKASLMPKNSVVFAKVGAALKLNKRRILSMPMAIDNNMMAAIPDADKVEHEYLYYFLLTQDFGRFSQESAVPSVNQQHMADIAIPLPPLPEQRKIAAILRTWDEAIEKLEKVLELKRKVRTSLIAHTISNKAPNTPLKHFVTNVVRAVPKPLEPYSSLGLRSHCKGTFQRFVEDFNRVEMDTLYQVKANDLIVNITFAWEGAVAIVKPEDEHCLVSHRFPTYEIDLKKAYPDFVRYIIQTRRFTELMGIISPGGAGRNRVLNKKDFLEQKVWLPDLKTQKFIGDLLCKAEEDINVTLKLLDTYKSQKRGLMQKLLTGEWPVQVDELPNKKEKQYVG